MNVFRKLVLLAASLICIQCALSQTVTIQPGFEAGPFGQGSTITVPLKISGCFAWNNVLRLYLYNTANATETLIGTFAQNGFFTTHINGRIPNGTPAGTGYYVIVKADRPAVSSTASSIFEVKNVAAPVAFVNATSAARRLVDSGYFGFCTGGSPNPSPITLINQSTAGSVTTINYTDENSHLTAPLPMSIGNTADVTLDVTFYTLFIKAEKNGVISTRGVFLINTTHKAGQGGGSIKACLPAPLQVQTDTSDGVLGIGKNFPGAYYVFTWGDNSKNDTLTHCQLLQSGGTVTHAYATVSCGINSPGSPVTNAYPINSIYINPFRKPGNPNNCDNVAFTGYAKIFSEPHADFRHDSACVGKPNVFINTSIGGFAQDGDNCTTDRSNEWWVDGMPAGTSQNLTYSFLTPGIYLVKLKVDNITCAPSEMIKEVCVEPEPVLDFKVNNQDSVTGCTTPFVVNIINLTNGVTCRPFPRKWLVYNDSTGALILPGPTTYSISPSDTASQPVFTFFRPGRYRIQLSVTSACGAFVKNKIVKILSPTTVKLPGDKSYCISMPVTIDFGTNVNHKPDYSGGTGSYLWTVTGGIATFVTGNNIRFPIITFSNNAVYTVVVTYTTECGVQSATQHISFNAPVIPDTGTDSIRICYFQDTISLRGSVTGAIDSVMWKTNGTGTFTPQNQVTSMYIMSAADKLRPNLYLVLQAFPAAGACEIVSDTLPVKTSPNNVGRDTAKTICTGISTNFSPVSSVSNSSFSFTSQVIAGNVTGNSSNSGPIDDVLTNLDPLTDGKVEYTITPSFGNCPGPPFKLIVTVKPRPSLTLNKTVDAICTGQQTNIQYSGSLDSMLYLYSSVVVSGTVTGNSNSPVPQSLTAINDVLSNSGTLDGVVVYTITPISRGCAGTPQTVTIVVRPGVSNAIAGDDQRICELPATTLSAANPVIGTGFWRQVGGPLAQIADPANPSTAINGLLPDNTYRFVWEVSATGASCGNSIDTVVIFVRSQTSPANAGPDSTTCAPNINSFKLQGNMPRSYETGHWDIVSTNMTGPLQFSDASRPDCIVSGLTQGTLRLKWTITSDATGCNATSDEVVITVGAITFTANAGFDEELCVTTTTLSGNNVAGVRGRWVNLSTGATILDPSQNITQVTNLQYGANIFVWVLDNLICPPSTDTVEITVYRPLVNVINNDPVIVCAGQQISISGSPATGGTGTYSYQWQQSTDNISFTNIIGATAANLTIAPVAHTYYRRVVKSPPCESESLSVLVTVRPDISNNVINPSQAICINTAPAILSGNVPVGGYGSFIYQWESSIDGVNWSTIPGADQRSYQPGVLTRTTSFRRKVKTSLCLDLQPGISNVVVINVNPDAKAEFHPDSAGCPPLLINHNTLRPVYYNNLNSSYEWLKDGLRWHVGPIYPPDTMYRVWDSITISMVAFSRFGCKSDTFSVGFATGAPPVFSLGPDDTVIAGTERTLSPAVMNGPAVSYKWSPALCNNCPAAKIVIDTDTTVILEIKNRYCVAYDTIHFRVKCDSSQIYIPNAFSPDGDGINDFFMIRGKGITIQSLFIFNRWGQKVFEKNNVRPNDLNTAWDGRVRGVITPEVYTYVAYILCSGGTKYLFKGNLTLVLISKK